MNTSSQIILNAGLWEFKKREITIASQLVDNLPGMSAIQIDKLCHIEALNSDRFHVLLYNMKLNDMSPR